MSMFQKIGTVVAYYEQQNLFFFIIIQSIKICILNFLIANNQRGVVFKIIIVDCCTETNVECKTDFQSCLTAILFYLF